MNLQLFAGEKTEKATPKKRQEARKRGQVPQSMEVPSALVLLGTLLCLLAFGGYYRDRVFGMFGSVLNGGLLMEITPANVMSLFSGFAVQLMWLMAPIFAVALVMAVFAGYAQFGLLFTPSMLRPNFKRLNPITGFRNLFSLRSVAEFVKSILKLILVGIVVYSLLWSERHRFLMLANVSVEEMFAYTVDLVARLILFVAVLLFLLSIADYAYQRYEYEKSLRMSKQDIKDEHKQQEGDPLVRNRIRQKQRQIAMMRMMQEVPKADVVITNPTHYAVAMRYDGATMEAPKVVAKGADYMAIRIREIARAHDVAIVENRPLARTLYERTEVGDTIPADLYHAVAEVLAYVYRLKGKRQA
jgi:flagellar biosynthetic protein FlhB